MIPVDVKTRGAVPTSDYINIAVDAVVNAKVSDNPEKLKASIQNFLNGTPDEIKDMVSDRKRVSERVLETAIPDLEKLGVIENPGVDKTVAIAKVAEVGNGKASPKESTETN